MKEPNEEASFKSADRESKRLKSASKHSSPEDYQPPMARQSIPKESSVSLSNHTTDQRDRE